MNIFVLDYDPVNAARMQCNAHVVKMILESAQMLSTAHRILDGKMTVSVNDKNRKVKIWTITDDHELDNILYKSVHVNHPCTKWTMASIANYQWHYKHFTALCEEYKFRYGKIHKTDKMLRNVLSKIPINISSCPQTQFPLAMKSNPECMNPDDPVTSYRLFYQTKQQRFKMNWTHRKMPDWFIRTV